MTAAAGARRLEALVQRIMPNGRVPVEIADGLARTRVGAGEPRVRIRIKDRAAVRRLLFRRTPLVALALAYAEGALDIDGDILEAARLKDNFPQRALTLRERLGIAVRLLRW